MNFLKNIEDYLEHIALIAVFAILSMAAYALTSPEPPKTRIKSMLAGGVIAGILSHPTWLGIGFLTPNGVLHVGWLIPITFVYTVSGQFIPEFLQSVVPKLIKKLFNRSYKAKTGEEFDHDN